MELKKDSSKEAPLFVISVGTFEYSSAVQPRLMPLDINIGLLTIHIIFGTSDTNEATFCTHVNHCVVMNVGNIQLHQCIITNNPDILESCIQFDYYNPFYPIHLNCPLNEEKE